MSIIDRFISSQSLQNFKQYVISAFNFSHKETDDDCIDCEKDKNGKLRNTPAYYTLEDKVKKLPFIHQAADLKARLIFSQGYKFTPKDESLDIKDDTIAKKIAEDRVKLWEIFNRPNGLGQDLKSQLFTAVVQTELFGHSGLQAYDWESPDKVIFQTIRWNQFLIIINNLTRAMKGRMNIFYYLINLHGFKDEDVQLKIEEKSIGKQGDSEYKYKVIPFEFVHFNLNTESAYGVSPLYYDQLSTQLIIDVLKDNIAEVNNDGFKGVIIKGVRGMAPRELGINPEQLPENWQDQVVQKFLNAIRKSMKGKDNKDNILYLNGALVDDIQKMERGFKSLEYLKYVEDKASVIAASMLGILNAFLGDKNSTYAQNIGEAIKFAVNYSINPSQLKYGEIITERILDRYINGRKFLNYDYKYVFNPLDLSDPKIEAETNKLMGEFVTTLQQNGISSINEVIKFLNKKMPELELSLLEDEINDAGDQKTTRQTLLPINFAEIEPDPDDDDSNKNNDGEDSE